MIYLNFSAQNGFVWCGSGLPTFCVDTCGIPVIGNVSPQVIFDPPRHCLWSDHFEISTQLTIPTLDVVNFMLWDATQMSHALYCVILLHMSTFFPIHKPSVHLRWHQSYWRKSNDIDKRSRSHWLQWSHKISMIFCNETTTGDSAVIVFIPSSLDRWHA